MKLPAYPKYKPSGVEWLGDVPEGWKTIPLRRVVTEGISNGLFKKRDDFGRGTLLLNVFDVYQHDFRINYGALDRVNCTDKENKSYEVLPNDLFFVRSSLKREGIAVVCVATECPESVVYECHLIRARPDRNVFDGRFGSYVLNSSVYRAKFIAKAKINTMTTIDQESIISAYVPIPPLPEQKSIADFLDRETSKLDALISKQRELIERLTEKRRALVSRCVTRGLPPEAAKAAGLDPHPKMKPSGVEWLGDVSEGWDVSAIKYVFQNLDRRRIPLSSEERASHEKNFPYYGASGVIDQVENYIFDEPLILVAEDGANLLSRSSPLAFLAEGKYWVNNHAHILRPKVGDIRYWVSVLQIHDYTPLVSGAAQPKLTSERLSSIGLPQPPAEEQFAIADFLDRETGKVDSLVTNVEQAIDRLQEYRTALITAAVTGKIDVREVEI